MSDDDYAREAGTGLVTVEAERDAAIARATRSERERDELSKAVGDTLCDEPGCSRCRFLRAAIQGEKDEGGDE